MKNAILAILSFALLSAADYSIEMKDSEGKVYHLGDIRINQSNDKILPQVIDQIKNRYSGFNINILVDGGTVTLKGTVNSEQDKRAIEREVQGLDGVNKVNNELEVQK